MKQAALFDGFAFDPFSLLDDRFSPSETGIGRSHVFEVLVVALMVVMLDERFDLRFEITGQTFSSRMRFFKVRCHRLVTCWRQVTKKRISLVIAII